MTLHAPSTAVRPGGTLVKGASKMPDSPHDRISPRCRCYPFCAYRNVSDFLRGNILYTGNVIEYLVSAVDTPSAPLRGGR